MAYQTKKTASSKDETPEMSGGFKTSSSSRSSGSSSWVQGLITLVLLIVIVGGGIYFMTQYSRSSIVLKAEWQAVFLDNGQVYFGKVLDVSDDTVELQDIYYLQVVNQPLQRSLEDGEAPADQQQDQRLTLFKFGNEIHGPQDRMIINRDHVIIIEDLKDDSRVVQAINDYLAGN